MSMLYGDSNKRKEDGEAIDWLLEHEDDKLTSWEVDFIEGVVRGWDVCV